MVRQVFKLMEIKIQSRFLEKKFCTIFINLGLDWIIYIQNIIIKNNNKKFNKYSLFQIASKNKNSSIY